jgi:hypothetical protein
MKAVSVSLSGAFGVWGDPNDNIYISDRTAQVIRMVSFSGIISTIAGITSVGGYNLDNIPANNAKLSSPNLLRGDQYGNIYIADQNNYRIRKLTN